VNFSLFGIEMVDLYSLTAPTTASKEAARMAREAYEKRKTKQVSATKGHVAADAEVDPLPDSRFGSLELWLRWM
jgi:hypothetical protein